MNAMFLSAASISPSRCTPASALAGGKSTHERRGVVMGINRWCRVALALAAVTVGLGPLFINRAAEPAAADWKLVWSDDFDGKELDRTKWDYDLGNGFFN